MHDLRRKRGFWVHVLLFFERLGYGIEWSRGVLLNPLLVFGGRCCHVLRTTLFPKVEGRSETPQRSKKDLIRCCLHSQPLSFFDRFSVVKGVPAYFLHRRCTPSKSAFEQQDSESVGVCSFSLDSSKLAICYLSGVVTIWDTNDGTQIEETFIHGGTVSSVSFLGEENSVLLICSGDYTCWRWEIHTNGSKLQRICDREKVATNEGEIFSQRCDFYEDGTKLLVSTIISGNERRKLDVALVNTSFDSCECGICHLTPVEVENDFVISGLILSPNGKGILVSFVDQGLEDSYCLLWPNCDEDPTIYKKLEKGTIGNWSFDNAYVVTWIMTNKPDLVVDDENSVFIWNVEEMCNSLTDNNYAMEPRRITNPFGDKVFWCQLTEDTEGHGRLIMGIIGETARFLFIDTASETHTHTIETGISTKGMILCNGEAWIESYVSQRSVKGLSPMDFSFDRNSFGAILGLPSDLLIWDAHRGIELLRISSKDLGANQFKGGTDLVMSPSSAKFAIVGSNGVLVVCPSTPSKNAQKPKTCVETQMVQLDNPHTSQHNLSSFKMIFSGDGDSLGVLRTGSSKMQVWNLPQGNSCIIESAHNEEGGNIQDFCLSNNGQYSVINIGKCIEIMDCKAKDVAQMVGLINVDSKVVSMGINEDASELVLCMEDGSIWWYKLSFQAVQHDAQNVASTSTNDEFVGQGLSFMERFKLWFKRPSVDVKEPLIDNNDGDGPPPSGYTSLHIRHDLPSLTYTRHVLAEESDEATFQVSPIFEEVIRVSELQGVQIWDLKAKMELKDGVSDIAFIKRTSHSYSRASSITQQVSEDLKSKKSELLSGTSVDLTKRTTLIQSSRENVIVAANAFSQGLIQKTNQTVFDVEYEDGKHEDFHSVYVINCKEAKYLRKLKGRNLEPEKGLAISQDGRHIACFAGGNASKIVVWNVHASDHLLLDYTSLSLGRCRDISCKEAIKRDILPLMKEFGINFINYQHPNGMSILEEAIYCCNNELLRAIVRYALKKKIKVSFLFSRIGQARLSISNSGNMVEVSIAGRSPKTVGVMVKYLLKRVTHEAEVATILTHSLVGVLKVYPTVFARVVRDRRIWGPSHEIKVREQVFENENLIVKTSESLILSPKDTQEFLEKKIGSHAFYPTTSPTIVATMTTLPIADACNIACQGLLHNLLINHVDYSVFSAFTLKAIVSFKWREYGQRHMALEFAHYMALIGAYTAFCFELCTNGTHKTAYHFGNEENSNATQISLLICWLLAVPCLYRDLLQCTLYVSSKGYRGFFYWLCSARRWMEVQSYLIIVILIPLSLYFQSAEGRTSVSLSSIVALEALLLWSRVLYYATPLPRIGKFVVVISSAISAAAPFMLVAFCTMFGFAISFHVLYRHVNTSLIEDESIDDHVLELLYKSFGSFGRTLFTVFEFTFGQFDLETVYYAPSGAVAAFLFVLYMITVSTSLYNLLIAVMTNEFDGIRDREGNHILHARAMVIEDIESMMSDRRRWEISQKIGKYLHIITPSFGHEELLRGSRQPSIPTMDTMTKTFRRLIRREMARSRKGSVLLSAQAPERRLKTQNNVGPSGSPLDSIQEEANSCKSSHRVETPLVGHTDPEESASDSDSTDSEFLDRYVDEALD